MKQITLTLFLLLAFIYAYSQTKQIATYYDYRKTVVKERYSVLTSNPTVFHGPYKYYAENGVIGEEGAYTNGNKSGKWTIRSSSDGLIEMIITYNQNGERDGYFMQNCNKDHKTKIAETTYKNGKLNGLYVGWDCNGKIIKQGKYVDGQPDGDWVIVEDGITHNRTYKNGEIVGKVISRFPNGKIQQIQDYRGDTTYVSKFFENGNKAMEVKMLKAGNIWIMDGVKTTWFENGNKNYEESYIAAQLNGKSSNWYENGIKSVEGEYKNGNKIGVWSEWYSNGKMKSKIDYSGQKNGEYYNELGEVTEVIVNGQTRTKSDILGSRVRKLFRDVKDSYRDTLPSIYQNEIKVLINEYENNPKLSFGNAPVSDCENFINKLQKAKEKFNSIKNQKTEILSKYSMFKNAYSEDKPNKNLFIKTDFVINSLIGTYDNAISSDTKLKTGSSIIAILDKVISLKTSDNKELNKQIKNIESEEDLRKLLKI